jgi:hypothetical protein
MPENPHKKIDLDEETEKLSEEKDEIGEKSSWSEDQKTRSYYYDDACGYEIYQEDDDDEEEDQK